MQSDQSNILEMPTVGVDKEAARSAFDLFSFFASSDGGFWAALHTFWSVYTIFAFIISAILIYGIIYSYIKFNELSEVLADKLKAEEERWKQAHDPDQGNRRWMEVEEHVHSNNPNDWKLAIIEADVMLEKMLEEAGFAGVTIADRLRSASGRSFGTIEDAWQAHRVRNQIAHGGSDFVLTQRMAQATIIQYKKVFQEFGVV